MPTEQSKGTTVGDLRVYHNPQIPGPLFKQPVTSVEEAKFLLATLWEYDNWQYLHQIKGDYSSASGLEVWDGEEWVDWHDPETDEDICEAMQDYLLEGRVASTGP